LQIVIDEVQIEIDEVQEAILNQRLRKEKLKQRKINSDAKSCENKKEKALIHILNIY